MSPRPRERILGNLEAIYREAYERAKAAGDQTRMADVDAAYQREQLLLEVLLDIRDALAVPPAEAEGSTSRRRAPHPVAALETIPRITTLRYGERMTRRAGRGLLSLTLAACGRTAHLVIRGGLV